MIPLGVEEPSPSRSRSRYSISIPWKLAVVVVVEKDVLFRSYPFLSFACFTLLLNGAYNYYC